jgi:hypothetical protein
MIDPRSGPAALGQSRGPQKGAFPMSPHLYPRRASRRLSATLCLSPIALALGFWCAATTLNAQEQVTLAARLKLVFDMVLDPPGEKDKYVIDPATGSLKITSNGGKSTRRIAFETIKKQTAPLIASAIKAHQIWLQAHGEAITGTPDSSTAFDAWLKDPFNIPPSNILPTTSDIGYIRALESIGFKFEDALRRPVWQDREIGNENFEANNRLASTLAIHDAVLLVRSEQHNASGQGTLTQSALEAFRPFMAPAASSGSIRDTDRYGSPYYRPRVPGGRK